MRLLPLLQPVWRRGIAGEGSSGLPEFLSCGMGLPREYQRKPGVPLVRSNARSDRLLTTVLQNRGRSAFPVDKGRQRVDYGRSFIPIADVRRTSAARDRISPRSATTGSWGVHKADSGRRGRRRRYLNAIVRKKRSSISPNLRLQLTHGVAIGPGQALKLSFAIQPCPSEDAMLEICLKTPPKPS